MSYEVRFTKAAQADLQRLYAFQLQRDLTAARSALQAIGKAIDLLRNFPYACRKASAENPFVRELLISFGSSGYVALYEIEDDLRVTILALRHQLEDDYH